MDPTFYLYRKYKNNISNYQYYITLDLIENDPIVFYGFVKQVEIIGEAVYMLTKEFRAAHPEVEWDEIEGMRHVLVHGYYQIRPSQLWDTIENDIPELQLKIRALYESMA